MIKIRLATPEDANTISALVRSLSPYFTVEPDGKGAEHFFESISSEAIEGYIHSPNFAYFIASDEARLVGVAALRDTSHIYHLFVASEFHGKGYGRVLWQHLCQHAKQLGSVTRLTVNSSTYAEKMYRHFGFEPTAEKQVMHGLAFIPMQITLTET
ncbi:GNAT family N-acetyltransferase [Undibacterium sp. LX40W]|uniref:GNAT family N-acetyltransferase n=1 Tax=Undibacterium nitidum TaxID=2762298 RepID=A0A923HRR4_9BURK|nr:MULTISPECIES: GNAT family N-acetyltransferase [Undibacterium]MBC3882876.1 GNAT family N-acetyltransferase [Undibacterium nitidum]MBC3893157.1 GNAT family N-acetyltransferase [Undibacterium sp. LX40W]